MKARIPTLIAIFVLFAATASVVFTISQANLLKSSADTIYTPQDIKITNITDNSFTVTWITKTPSIGFIEFWSPGSTTNKSDITPNSQTHLITINNLSPGSPTLFQINSGGNTFTNSGSPWSVQTLSSQITNGATIVSGTVLNEAGLPAKDALVFIDTGTQTFSTLVSVSGNWVTSIPQNQDTLLQIFVESSTSSIALAKIDSQNANPVPTITLGNSYDFRNQQTTNTKLNNPKVDIQLP
jgi:hypothetical protein